MGMAGRLGQMWGQANGQYLPHRSRPRRVGRARAFSKVDAHDAAIGVLGIGAYLVIHNEATGGIMIASSILVSQALAPVELAIANWKGFVGARQGWARLRTSLEDDGSEVRPLQLPAPQASLMVEGAGCGAPQSQRFAVQDVSLELKAGMGLGVIGPKCVRQVVARPHAGRRVAHLRGKVRLDGAALDQWLPEELRTAHRLTCRRTSSCSPERLPRTSPASMPIRRPRTWCGRPWLPMSMT